MCIYMFVCLRFQFIPTQLTGCTVAIDGTLFKKHPKLSRIMRDTLSELIPGNQIRIVESEDGSGKGAAIIAAIVSLP